MKLVHGSMVVERYGEEWEVHLLGEALPPMPEEGHRMWGVAVIDAWVGTELYEPIRLSNQEYQQAAEALLGGQE